MRNRSYPYGLARTLRSRSEPEYTALSLLEQWWKRSLENFFNQTGVKKRGLVLPLHLSHGMT